MKGTKGRGTAKMGVRNKGGGEGVGEASFTGWKKRNIASMSKKILQNWYQKVGS